MNTTPIQKSVLSLLLSILTCVSASAAELFVELKGDELERVERENHYFLSQYRHFSKRVRVVKINTEALFEGDDLSITLFPDTVVEATRSNISYRNSGLGFKWKGVYTKVPQSPAEFVAAQKSNGIELEAAMAAYDSLVSFEISGSLYSTDQRTGLPKSLVGSKVDGNTGEIRGSALDRRAKHWEDDYFDVSATLLPPPDPEDRPKQFPDRYVQPIFEVRSLEMNRRYHVVYEVATEKLLPTRTHGRALMPESVERLRRFKELKDSLGEDPRIAVRAREEE